MKTCHLLINTMSMRSFLVAVAVALGSILSDPTEICLLYTSPSPRDRTRSRMPSSA